MTEKRSNPTAFEAIKYSREHMEYAEELMSDESAANYHSQYSLADFWIKYAIAQSLWEITKELKNL